MGWFHFGLLSAMVNGFGCCVGSKRNLSRFKNYFRFYVEVIAAFISGDSKLIIFKIAFQIFSAIKSRNGKVRDGNYGPENKLRRKRRQKFSRPILAPGPVRLLNICESEVVPKVNPFASKAAQTKNLSEKSSSYFTNNVVTNGPFGMV